MSWRRSGLEQMADIMQSETHDTVTVIYDGDCPFCSSYADVINIRKNVGELVLIDARQGGPVVERVRSEGFDLDEGMVMLYRGETFHGAECMHMISKLSKPRTFMSRTLNLLTRSKPIAVIVYPVLRLGRNLTLALLGRRKFRSS